MAAAAVATVRPHRVGGVARGDGGRTPQTDAPSLGPQMGKRACATRLCVGDGRSRTQDLGTGVARHGRRLRLSTPRSHPPNAR